MIYSLMKPICTCISISAGNKRRIFRLNITPVGNDQETCWTTTTRVCHTPVKMKKVIKDFCRSCYVSLYGRIMLIKFIFQCSVHLSSCRTPWNPLDPELSPTQHRYTCPSYIYTSLIGQFTQRR